MCTRILWKNNVGVFSGRSMDWPESTHPILTVLPRGMQRDGDGAGPRQSRVVRKRVGAIYANPGAVLACHPVKGGVVVVRILLGWALVVEIEGRWPWQPGPHGEQNRGNIT